MELVKGVSLQIQNTDKFKDIGISIRFMAPLSSEHATLRSLLAIMMTDRCIAYPSKKAMNDQQDLLYGLSLGAQTVGYGKAQVLEIRSKIINPQYVKEPDLLAQVFAYLREVIFAPLLNEETLAEAKAVLKAKLQRIKDDPAQYALMRGLQLGGENSALAISSLGEELVCDQATLTDIKNIHGKLLNDDQIDMIVCGQVEMIPISEMVKAYLPFKERTDTYETHYVFHGQETGKRCQEERDINQCSIFMLWESNTDICDRDYYALRIGNAMLGQYPTSLLFQEVREKRSLCYSIYSTLISFDGALGVTTGVEPDHMEEAISLIHEQFQRIVNGDFDDHLLAVSKTMTINSLKASKDAMNSIIAQLYQNAVLHQNVSVDERIKHFTKVKKEDVMRAFSKCKHQLSFVVCQEVKA